MTTLYTTFLLFVALVRPLHMLGRWGKRREKEVRKQKFLTAGHVGPAATQEAEM